MSKGKLQGRGGSPFARVPKANIPRSVFNRDHAHKTTFDGGQLIPIYVDEALPGDTFTLRMQAFARLATPLKPIMDNLHLETFFFSVPNRLLWDNWKRFNGEQTDPDDSTDYTIPQAVAASGVGHITGSLGDHMGIPVGIPDFTCSALPFRAFNLIFNEWFRDQNLQDSVPVPKDDGPDLVNTNYGIYRRGKRHDYFTSALPWPQKMAGATQSVGIPVSSTGEASLYSTAGQVSSTIQIDLAGGTDQPVFMSGSNVPGGTLSFGDKNEGQRTGLEVLVNQMRQSVQIQKLLERDARGGSRYTEIIRAHFGVTSDDARQQRPEYLGGGYAPVILNPVAQTTPEQQTGVNTPQGNLSAVGTSSVGGHGFHKSFTEHCTLIGLVCVRADQSYQQGLDRMWSRQTRYDFYWPALSQIGEQAVLNKEINVAANPEGVFGYQERYAEYRYKKSEVTGLFRSNVTSGFQTLDMWHLAQDYQTGLPVLDSNFIEENPPIDRVIAVPGEVQFLFDSFFSLKCARPMPVFGTPGFVDHF